jgi:hypothetical protein
MTPTHDEKSDRDLMITAVNDIAWIKQTLRQHLSGHLAITVSLIGIGGTAILGLFFALIGK